ncbi:hypothetical protein [Sphingobacterium sp. DR205]|uniref:hypothetical protein n=1 Tax=Sphingobacterium sp. DR205 TaxID=2713573 RepID=UPI0013E4699F|nr:hypothetical protein [Sphingobacterium sp. DR205]QIH34548.1 hypothetical protein G6053_17335 [Sphingobacterium sp. DR205]
MNINLILQNLNRAITELLEKEAGNLLRGLSELNISTHLTFYLKPYFQDYNVDAEYNGDIDKENDRKALVFAKNRMLEIGLEPNDENNYRITPDIIIHTRESNENNLVVIEIKKDSHSRKHKEFDLIKLEHLTIDYLGNHYNYKLGVALIFGTKKNTGTYEIRFFQNGNEILAENLV